MSVSYRAVLVYGLPYSEVFGKVTHEAEVTKYHEDTGQPYTVKKVTKTPTLFGQPAALSTGDLERLDDNHCFGEPYSGEADPEVFGILIATADDYRDHLRVIEPAKLSEAGAELHRLIAELCRKYGVQPPKEHNPKLYLILSCS